MRQGELDALSGQRAAFPECGGEAGEYLRKVRLHALSLLRANTAKRSWLEGPAEDCPCDELPYGDPLPVSGVPVVPVEVPVKADGALVEASMVPVEASVEAPEASKSVEPIGESKYILTLSELKDPSSLYLRKHPELSKLPPVHPEECTSLASWKQYMVSNDPVPVNREDTLRLLKYLTRWFSNTPNPRLYSWALTLILRLEQPATADEIAVLRDVCRALAGHAEEPRAGAFIAVTAHAFGQRDLLMF